MDMIQKFASLGIVPVIKLTGNRFTFANMKDNVDFDASRFITGEAAVDEMAEELYDELLAVCSGRVSKAESLGYTETAIARWCNYA